MRAFRSDSLRTCLLLSLVLVLGLSSCRKSSSNNCGSIAPPAAGTFTVGGTLSGLPLGGSITLQNNGGDDLILVANGAFTFATAILDGAGFDVQVSSQPAAANCVVANGVGTVAGANVTNVVVTCTVISVPSGSLDPTFNSGGAIPGVVVEGTLGTGLVSSASNSCVIDANGKILVTGHTTELDISMAIWRFNADGTSDPTFNAGGAIPGLVTHDKVAGGVGVDQGRAITVDASGRILVAGISRGPFNFDMALWRFLPDGTLDTSFNATGPVPGAVVSAGAAGGNGSDSAQAIVVDANGKILVAGAGASLLNNAFTDMVVWRFNDDGSLDTSFNPSGAIPGVVSFNGAPLGAGDEVGSAIAIDAMNRIVVAGSFETSIGVALAVWRLTPEGALDPTIDTTGLTPGLVTLDISPDNFNRATGVAVDANGKLVVVGHAGNGVIRDLVLLRLNSDGTLDGTFNAMGTMPGLAFHNNAAGGNRGDSGAALAIDSNGKIVIAGLSENATPDNDLAVWRYNADGTLDSSFNPSGTIPGVFTHHNAAGGDNGDLGNSIAIDALGNLVVTGTSIHFVGTAIITTRMVLWRIAP